VFTDRMTLRTAAYADHRPLAARVAIYQWQRDRVDLPGVALAALRDVRGTVLDAGCGLGTYVDRLRADRPDLLVLPLDLSAGMGPEVVGDIQALPLADDAVGAALAMHMLYHVPGIPAAVRELRRVVEPGGVLVVSTNGADDKAEVGQLWVGAVHDLTGITVDLPDFDGRFTLDDGDLLRAAFDHVSLEVYRRETLVPEVEPVVAFIDSMQALSGQLLPDGVTWPAFLDAVRARVTAEVERNGVWRLGNETGVFTCR
jgi:SAM-dependent methyltransferase